MPSDPIRSFLRRKAIENGVVNFVINGLISGYSFWGEKEVRLTPEHLGESGGHVFGTVVPVTVIISFLVATLSIRTLERLGRQTGLFPLGGQRPHWLRLSLRIGAQVALEALGVVMLLSLTVARVLPGVTVSGLVAALVVAFLCGVMGWVATVVILRRYLFLRGISNGDPPDAKSEP